MTRKDYEAIASSLVIAKQVVKSFPDLYTPEVAINLAANIIADALMASNQNFRYSTFMKAAEAE